MASSAPPTPGPSMKPALLNAPATPLAPLKSSSATNAGMAPVTAADSAPWVEAASTTTGRSWRSPTWPDHGDTAVETPNTASIAPDTHQEEPVDSYSTQIRAVIAAPRPA